MRKIKINNSKLSIQVWNESVIPEEFKNKLIVCSDPYNSLEQYVDVNSISFFNKPISILYKNKSVLIKESRVFVNKEPYSKKDLNIILSHILVDKSRSGYDQDTIEQLVLSTLDKDIIDEYRKSNSEYLIGCFKGKLYNIVRDEKYTVSNIADDIDLFRFYRKDYNRYSVYSLLKDLVRTKSKIMIDSGVIGHYNNITVKKVDKLNENNQSDSLWSNINNIVYNSQRANLSLSLDVKVDIDIPENEYNIPKGKTKFLTKKTYNIVKDGDLNITTLYVKVSDTKFKKKLSHIPGLIMDYGIYNDEIFINLLNIPLVNNREVLPCSPISLNRLLVNKVLFKYAIKYLGQLIENKTKDNESIASDKEKFLSGLGINGNYYFPLRTVTKSTGELYTSPGIRCISKIEKLRIRVPRVIDDEVISLRKLPEEKAVLRYLKKIDISDLTKIPSLIKDYERKLKETNRLYSKFIFRIIMGKTGVMSDKSIISKPSYTLLVEGEKIEIKYSFNYNITTHV